MDLGIIKLIFGLSLVLMTFIGGLMPIKFKGNKSILSLGNVLSAGVFLGTCLLHMIPEATETLDAQIDEKWKLSYLLSGCGLITIVFFEESVLFWQRKLSLNRKRKLRRRSSNIRTNSKRTQNLEVDGGIAIERVEHTQRDEDEEGDQGVIEDTVVQTLYPRSCLVTQTFILPENDQEVEEEKESEESEEERKQKNSIGEICDPTTTTTTTTTITTPTLMFQGESRKNLIEESLRIESNPSDENNNSNSNNSRRRNHHQHNENDLQNQNDLNIHNDDHHDHHGIDKDLIQSGNEQQQQQQGVYLVYVLVIALSIHSFFESAALGAETDTKGVLYVWLAISSHKILSSFALGSSLLRAEVGKIKLFKLLGVFCLTTVFGIGLGYFLTETSDSSTSEIISGIANSFAAGTFFYIGLCDILPKELSDNSPNSKFSMILLKLFSFCFGFFAMYILGIFAE